MSIQRRDKNGVPMGVRPTNIDEKVRGPDSLVRARKVRGSIRSGYVETVMEFDPETRVLNQSL